MTKDNKRLLQGASRTQSGVNRPHLVPSQNAEETQIIACTHTHTHTYTHSFSLSVSFSPCLSLPTWPDQSRVASSPGPGSPKELSPIVSKRKLQLDQFNVRKHEEGRPQCPSVAGCHVGATKEAARRRKYSCSFFFKGHLKIILNGTALIVFDTKYFLSFRCHLEIRIDYSV